MTTRSFLATATMVAAGVSILALSGCSAEVEEQAPVVRPIRILTIEDYATGRQLRYAGRVEAGEQAELGFEVSGRIIELPVIESQMVSEGEQVARLDPADFQSRLNQAQADFNAAEATFNRFSELVETGAISRQEFDQRQRDFEVAGSALETAQKALSDTRLLAPFEGNIGRTFVDNFTNVQAKQSVVLLQDMTELDVVISVPEQDWGRARPGMTLAERSEMVRPYVTTSTSPGRRFPARLTEISTAADPVTRTFEARVTIDQPEDVSILPGMTANVTITIPGEEDAIAGASSVLLPSGAVLSDDSGNATVWVVDPDTMIVSRRQVEIAELTGADVRVMSGLSSGDKVATSGVHNLREGMQVRELGN